MNDTLWILSSPHGIMRFFTTRQAVCQYMMEKGIPEEESGIDWIEWAGGFSAREHDFTA